MFPAQLQPMDKLLLVMVVGLVGSWSICFVHSYTIDTWGELCNVRAADHTTSMAKGFVFRIQNRTLAFPSVIMQFK